MAHAVGRDADVKTCNTQWGATLTWSAELPLPLPLQFDEVADGCRLGFVTVRDGAVCLVRTVVERIRII